VEVRRGKGHLVIHQPCVLKMRVTSGFRSLMTCGKGKETASGFFYHQVLQEWQLEARNPG